jgi:hypothetical protein
MKAQRPECKPVGPGDQLRSLVESGQRRKRFFFLRIPAKATTALRMKGYAATLRCGGTMWSIAVEMLRFCSVSGRSLEGPHTRCLTVFGERADSPLFHFVMVLHPGKLWWPLRLMPYGRAGRGSDSGVSSCICRKRAWMKKQQTRNSSDWHVILHCL